MPPGTAAERHGWRIRIRPILAVFGGILIGASLVLVSGGGWPAGLGTDTHETCVLSQYISVVPNVLIPDVMVNAPYGGEGWGNGTIPENFTGSWYLAPPTGTQTYGFGTSAANGTAQLVVVTVNFSVYREANVTSVGHGEAAPCEAEFGLAAQPPNQRVEEGGTIISTNSSSDVGEPDFAAYPGDAGASGKVLFDNGFSTPNVPNVSTCGGPSQTLSESSSAGLEVFVPVSIQGLNYSLPFALPFQESFHYWLPANFGAWEIDDLAQTPSGGGYAFSFTPCR
jgi:hypothetical protein